MSMEVSTVVSGVCPITRSIAACEKYDIEIDSQASLWECKLIMNMFSNRKGFVGGWLTC